MRHLRHQHHSRSFYRALREILEALLCRDDLAIQVTLRFGSTTVTFEGDFQMQLPDDKTATGVAKFVDAKGNVAQVQGVPVWATDRPDLLTVTDNGDGSASVSPVGPLGTAQVTCTGDADLGDGVQEVILMADVEVIAGTAVGGSIDLVINP